MSKRMPADRQRPPVRTGRAVRDVRDLVDADLPPADIELLALAAALVDPDSPDVQVVV